MTVKQLTPPLKSHFLNLFALALCDLNLDTKELELLYEFGRIRGISEEEINNLILNTSGINLKIPDSLEEKIEYLYDFALMIWADGKVEDFEKEYLLRFCRIFGFLDEEIENIANFLLSEAKKGTSFQTLINLVIKNSGESL